MSRIRISPWLCLAPALLAIGVFKFWPTIWGAYLSFFTVRDRLPVDAGRVPARLLLEGPARHLRILRTAVFLPVAALVLMVPSAAVYLLLQRFFTRGRLAGALK